MIPEILPFLLPVGKFILATALLVLFYQLFYKGKSTFDQSRVYLLSIVVVALLISQFHIVVYTPPVKMVVVEAPKMVSPVEMQVRTLVKDAPTTSAIQKAKVETSFMNFVSPFLTAQNIALMLYGLVTLMLLLSFIVQYFKILSIRRKGVVCQRVGFEIVESADIPTPFSFCKTIFIGKNLSGNKLEVILKHEQWHIKHHHYVDVMVMELLVRIFWFNPILWWVRKELRNVSEYQADRSVLDEGHDLYKYQTIILEEVMEQNPYLANGFNNSFTKKRFIMMKNTNNNRYKTLRHALLMPLLVSAFALLCFTTGKGQINYVTIQAKGDTKTRTPHIDSIKPIDTLAVAFSMLGIQKQAQMDSTGSALKMDTGGQFSETYKQEAKAKLDKLSHQLGLAINDLNKTSTSFSREKVITTLHKIYRLLEVKHTNIPNPDVDFSDEFLSSVSQQDLTQSSKNLIEIKTKLDQIGGHGFSHESMYEMMGVMMELIGDPLIEGMLGDLMQTNAKQMGEVLYASGLASKTKDSTTIKVVGDSAHVSQKKKISTGEKALKTKNLDLAIQQLSQRVASAQGQLRRIFSTKDKTTQIRFIQRCLYELDIRFNGNRLTEFRINYGFYAYSNQARIRSSLHNLGCVHNLLDSARQLDSKSKEKAYQAAIQKLSDNLIVSYAIQIKLSHMNLRKNQVRITYGR